MPDNIAKLKQVKIVYLPHFCIIESMVTIYKWHVKVKYDRNVKVQWEINIIDTYSLHCS